MQRVNLAMELVADTSLIFLDEPTTGLDATSAQEVMQYLALVARRKQVCHFFCFFLTSPMTNSVTGDSSGSAAPAALRNLTSLR